MAAPAAAYPNDDNIKLEYGVPRTFALKYTEGKSVQSKFPGGRVMFTATDEAKLFVDDEDASDLMRGMRELGIAAGELLTVTKIRHPRGGGHSLRVERPDSIRRPAQSVTGADDPRLVGQLEKSVEMARRDGPAAFARRENGTAAAAAPTGGTTSAQINSTAPAAPASAKGTMTGLLAGSLMAVVDAYMIAADYARSKGIPVTLSLDFNAEDVRQSSTAFLIQYWKDGGSRA